MDYTTEQIAFLNDLNKRDAATLLSILLKLNKISVSGRLNKSGRGAKPSLYSIPPIIELRLRPEDEEDQNYPETFMDFSDY